MYIANGSTASASITGGTWHVIGSSDDADFTVGAVSTNWSYASNSLIASASGGGTYLVKFSLSFAGSAITTYDVGISINGNPPSEILYQRTISNVNKDAGNVSGSANLTLANSGYVELQIKPAISATVTPIQAQVTLVELTDNSTNYYTGMSIYNNSTAQSLASSATYYAITGFNQISESNDWSIASSLLTAGANSAGTYLLTFSACFSGNGTDASPGNYTIGIAKNGAGADPTSIIANRKTSATDIGNVVMCGIMSISATNTISIEAKAVKTNVPITIQYASLALYKISGNASAPYAGMKITTNQSVAINTSDTWTPVGTYTPASLSDWACSANTLNPTTGTTSAGKYIIDYSLSINSPSASGSETILVGVFVGSHEHSELTLKRVLSSSTDVGAMGGTGILNIASVDSTISVKIKNVTNTNDLTVRKSRLSLHRFVEGSHDGSLPVELTAFSGNVKNGLVYLDWATESESENLGFIVERHGDDDSGWQELAGYKTNPALAGQGSVSHRTRYEYVDRSVFPGMTYQYRLADVDYSGKVKYHDPISISIPLREQSVLPEAFQVYPAFPNPFNPRTTINYRLTQDATVRVAVLDLQGREILILCNQPETSGLHQVTWDASAANGNTAGTGLYFIKLQAGDQTLISKVLLLK
ncbi:MAG: T9SS type A sorting domain-containing protein [Candidatus Neomarinimicrobiota bacterium]